MNIQFPNMKQIYAARDCLRDVLVNDQKLCPAVEKIEYVGQIERFGQLHYIFKFREPGGPWLVGVSGGYTSKDQIEPGEYVGSMGDAYNEGTVKGSAIALLDDMKNFMEGEEMDAIKAALEDEDVAGMVRELKDLAERSGLDISEDEIKKKVIEIMKSDDPDAALADFEEEEANGRFDEPEEGIEQFILLADSSLSLVKCKNEILKAIADKRAFAYKDDDRWVIEYLDSAVVLEMIGKPWTLEAKALGSLGFWPGAREAYTRHKDALSVWCYNEKGYTNKFTALLESLAVDVCLDVAGKKGLAIIEAGIIADPAIYRLVQEQADTQGRFPIENVVQPMIRPMKKNLVKLETHGLKAFWFGEMRMKNPVPIEEVDECWKDLLRFSMRISDARTPEINQFMSGQSGYAYHLKENEGPEAYCVEVEKLDALVLEEADMSWQKIKASVGGVKKINAMNRPFFFFLWAEKQGLMSQAWGQKSKMYKRQKEDIRQLGWDINDGVLLSDILTPEGAKFAKAYYNYWAIFNWYQEEDKTQVSYYMDLMKYANAHLPHRRADIIERIGIESPALLPWTPEIQAGVEDVIQKRYEEWKMGKLGIRN